MITYILIYAIYRGGMVAPEFSDRAACEAAKAALLAQRKYYEVALCVPKASPQG